MLLEESGAELQLPGWEYLLWVESAVRTWESRNVYTLDWSHCYPISEYVHLTVCKSSMGTSAAGLANKTCKNQRSYLCLSELMILSLTVMVKQKWTGKARGHHAVPQVLSCNWRMHLPPATSDIFDASGNDCYRKLFLSWDVSVLHSGKHKGCMMTSWKAWSRNP